MAFRKNFPSSPPRRNPGCLEPFEIHLGTTINAFCLADERAIE